MVCMPKISCAFRGAEPCIIMLIKPTGMLIFLTVVLMLLIIMLILLPIKLIVSIVRTISF